LGAEETTLQANEYWTKRAGQPAVSSAEKLVPFAGTAVKTWSSNASAPGTSEMAARIGLLPHEETATMTDAGLETLPCASVAVTIATKLPNVSATNDGVAESAKFSAAALPGGGSSVQL